LSREELVQGYLHGQLSRRVFLRRLIATGVTTAAALSYASVLEAVPAEAAVADFYLFIADYAFGINPARLALGQRVEFHNWSYAFAHTATDTTGMGLFDTGPLAHYAQATVAIPSAGTYPYHCSEPPSTHPAMTARLRAPLVITPPSGSVNTTFTVRWAPRPLPAGYVAEVERQAPGKTWKTWKSGATKGSAAFTTNVKGTWSFRARLRRVSNGATSGWSQTTHVTVS
jgi:plastocyanin